MTGQNSLYQYCLMYALGQKGKYPEIDSFQPRNRKRVESKSEEGWWLKKPSPYMLVFLRTLPPVSEPFALKGFYFLSEEEYKPHLCIDSKWYSSDSSILARRNLSYCHATEYFANGGQMIEVHYHFDKFGQLTQIRSDLKKYSLDGELLKNHYEISAAEHKLLKQRSKHYGALFGRMFEDKKNTYLDICQQIELMFTQIMEKFIRHNFKLEAITDDLETLKTNLQKRVELEDNGKDVSGELFINNLNILAAKAADEDVVELKEALEDKLATTVNHTKPAPKELKPQKKDVKVKLNPRLEIIEKKLASLRQGERKDYIAELDDLTNTILILHHHKDLTVAQKARLNKVEEQIKTMPTAMDFFTKAIQTGEQEKVNELYPHCSDRLNVEFYYMRLLEWQLNASEANKELVEKQEKVFDFLHENSAQFKYCIQNVASILHEQVDACGIGTGCFHNYLYMIYLANNPRMFAAVLRYGLNPFASWFVDKKEVGHNGMQIITKHPFNSSFYFEELLRYGVSIDLDDANDYFQLIDTFQRINAFQRIDTLAEAAKSIRNSAQNSEWQRSAWQIFARKKKRELQYFSSKSGAEGNQDVKLKSYSQVYGPFSPLVNLVTKKRNFYFKYPELCKAIAQDANVANLAVGLAFFINEISSDVMFLAESYQPGIYIAETPPEFKSLADHNLLQQGTHLHITICFFPGIPEPEAAKACFKNLLTELRKQIALGVDIESAKLQLKEKGKLAFLHGNYQESALYHGAIIVLFSLCKTLGEKEKNELMNLYKTLGGTYMVQAKKHLSATVNALIIKENYMFAARFYLECIRAALAFFDVGKIIKVDFNKIFSDFKDAIDGMAEEDGMQNMFREQYAILLDSFQLILNGEPEQSTSTSSAYSRVGFPGI